MTKIPNADIRHAGLDATTARTGVACMEWLGRDDMTITDEKVKTRKPHECRVCGETIAAGETVIRRAGFDCDGPWTVHMHPECEALTKTWDSMDWESIGPGEVKRPNPKLTDG